MPSEWYQDWVDVPVRRIGHIAADIVREADRRRDDSPMHPYSDDPADYDGWPVRDLGGVAEAALAWLRKECTDYDYPDFIRDASTNDPAWAFVQGETSTTIVTEEYLGIEGLEVEGGRVTGQVWHRIRRAIEALRWQMRLEPRCPLDYNNPPTTVENSVYITDFEEAAGSVEEAVSILNDSVWPSSSAYVWGGPSRAVTWIVSGNPFFYPPLSGSVYAEIRGIQARFRPEDLSYYDEIVRQGFAYRIPTAYTYPARFLHGGVGPVTDTATDRKIIWRSSIASPLTFELAFGDGLPQTFTVSGGGAVTPSTMRRDTYIEMLFVRDMEYDPGS